MKKTIEKQFILSKKELINCLEKCNLVILNDYNISEISVLLTDNDELIITAKKVIPNIY
jgi:hypothetical protein